VLLKHQYAASPAREGRCGAQTTHTGTDNDHIPHDSALSDSSVAPETAQLFGNISKLLDCGVRKVAPLPENFRRRAGDAGP
jgi:hypothetical protein